MIIGDVETFDKKKNCKWILKFSFREIGPNLTSSISNTSKDLDVITLKKLLNIIFCKIKKLAYNEVISPRL